MLGQTVELIPSPQGLGYLPARHRLTELQERGDDNEEDVAAGLDYRAGRHRLTEPHEREDDNEEEDAAGSFVVVLSREGSEPFGLIASTHPNMPFLIVDGITEKSLIGEWNRNHSASLQVRTGQSILSVNGRRGLPDEILEVLARLRPGEELRLRVAQGVSAQHDALNIRKPFEVKVYRAANPDILLGLLLCPDDHPMYLTIDDVITGSLVAQWNESNEEEFQVRVGDRILCVNDTRGSSEAMLDVIKVSANMEELNLLVV